MVLGRGDDLQVCFAIIKGIAVAVVHYFVGWAPHNQSVHINCVIATCLVRGERGIKFLPVVGPLFLGVPIKAAQPVVIFIVHQGDLPLT